MTSTVQDVLDDVDACDTHDDLLELAADDPRVHVIEDLVFIHPNRGRGGDRWPPLEP